METYSSAATLKIDMKIETMCDMKLYSIYKNIQCIAIINKRMGVISRFVYDDDDYNNYDM